MISGIRPAHQSRTIRNEQRLLAAGRKLLEKSEWDEISVAKISAMASCSVGAFYLRFGSKDQFLHSLVSDMLADARSRLDALYESERELEARLVARSVDNFREFGGILRAAARMGMMDPSYWTPIREFGQMSADRYIEHVGQREKCLTKRREQDLRFAYQMLLGTLVNSLINHPGPLNLDAGEFKLALIRAFDMLTRVSS